MTFLVSISDPPTPGTRHPLRKISQGIRLPQTTKDQKVGSGCTITPSCKTIRVGDNPSGLHLPRRLPDLWTKAFRLVASRKVSPTGAVLAGAAERRVPFVFIVLPRPQEGASEIPTELHRHWASPKFRFKNSANFLNIQTKALYRQTLVLEKTTCKCAAGSDLPSVPGILEATITNLVEEEEEEEEEEPTINTMGRGRGGGGGGGGGAQRHGDARYQPDNGDGSKEDFGTFNSSLPERFRGGNFRRNTATTTTMYNNGYRVELNMGPREYLQAQKKISSDNPRRWQSLPEIPSSEEVAWSHDQTLLIPANKVKGKWKNKEKYLRAHYELLREDSIAPIREAVDAVRKDPEMMDNKDLAIYEKVHIRGFTFARAGVAARISFSTARAGCKINWQSSSRLISGSILALTPAKDKFVTKCVVAIVAARPKAGIECIPPEIDIYFSCPDDFEIDPHTEWLMVEAKKGFYESMRYTMRALQKMSGEEFPLHDHICSLNPKLEAPAYIKPDADFNLSAAMPDITKKERLEKVNIINDWPDAPREFLDDTQWEAMRQILTKDISIIQGPPGTGKTFVSKVALQILVDNRAANDPPIIVAAQTNHALDQLLKQVSKFDSEYIRLGGRSKDEEVKRRALFEVRQANKLPPIPSSFYGLAQRRQEEKSQVLRESLGPLSPPEAQNPFSAAELFKLGVISQKQADSLVAGAKEWVTGGTEVTNETKVWLGKALIPWNLTYKEDSFGFEEAEDDLEFEQLREHEAESGQTDQEDIELLRGFWCAIEQHTTVSTPAPTVLEKAKRQLEANADIWKIPQGLRGPVYFVMREKAMTAMTVILRGQVRDYDRICIDLKTGIFERDAVYLSKANIIGLTTTGLSKYRPLIASMKPKIILIEEAAEVLEAPITAACFESVEHLILVGDHKQLQGHCTVEELGRAPYNLNVSMFERLVNNGIPYRILLGQRRMEPDFRQLLGPIYPELQDHPSVLTRKPLPPYGMGDVKSFFLDHDWPELRDAERSMFNDKEAEFIAGFYEYLMMNKVHPNNITILTFYNGQRKRILKYIRDRPLCKEEYHNVKTVDGYQGEENDIVILSLVRSNERNIGFLENENRICVALSRAKRGFYIFGNSHALGRNSELWTKVFNTLRGQIPHRIGNEFPLQCNKHGKSAVMRFPEDWSEHRSGCDSPCGELLSCGHACKLTCHPFDHSLLKCLNPCEKELNCGHPCQKKCFEDCVCNCAESDIHVGQQPGKPDEGSGRRGLWENRSPDRADKYEDSWGNSGNDGWAPADNTAEDQDWASGAGGTDWNTNWSNYGTSSKQLHQKKPSGSCQRQSGPLQVLARLPIRSEEEQAAKDRNDYKVASKMTFPAYSYGQISHSSRPSTSSSATPTNYGSGGGCQHSTVKQANRRGEWTVFANGGVKTDDKDRTRTLHLKKTVNEDVHNNFDKSRAFPLERALPGVREVTMMPRKDGKVIFNEEFQPAGCGDAFLEQTSPKSPKSSRGTRSKSYQLLDFD